MTNRELVKFIKEKVVGADTVGINESGNVVVRRQFFYHHGVDARSWSRKIIDQLPRDVGDGKILHEVDFGEVNRPFRGWATTRNQSHWWVELTVVDKKNGEGV